MKMSTRHSQRLPGPAASYATHFSAAITRLPADSAVYGLRTRDTGAVDVDLMAIQHTEYQQALRQAGAAITELPALRAYPDAQFVEDVALCLPNLAVMMRPCVKTRRGEVAPMRKVLAPLFENIADIRDGCIEAGDILITPSEVLVGMSARTNQTGADQLRQVLNRYGFAMRILETPSDILHLKTDCSLIDDQCILSTERLASSGCFHGYQTLLVPKGEEAAANMIRYNNHIIMPAGFPNTESMLRAKGFTIICVGNSECAKIDGGMSCLSLRLWL